MAVNKETKCTEQNVTIALKAVIFLTCFKKEAGFELIKQPHFLKVTATLFAHLSTGLRRSFFFHSLFQIHS